MNYLDAVAHKMTKKGNSDNEIKRELNRIQGIKETINIDTSKLKKYAKSDKTDAGE